MDTKTMQLIAMASGLMAESDPFMRSGITHAAEKQTKPCLQCGKEHSHNNSWCSSTCCKRYRRHKK